MRTALVLASILITSIAHAERPNTVTVDPLLGAIGFTGRHLGDWAVSYERRIAPRHALMVEQTGVHVHHDPFHLTLLGLGAGYRHHLRDDGGPFVGAVAGARLGTGRYGDMPRQPLGARGLFASAHVGWRWIASNGLTLTARVGAGWTNLGLDDDAPHEAHHMERDRLAPLPFELDGELGIGWSF